MALTNKFFSNQLRLLKADGPILTWLVAVVVVFDGAILTVEYKLFR